MATVLLIGASRGIGLELARQLPEQGPDLETIAAALALSPRTLQRRLREGGLSFSQLVDETRQQLVLHYLRDPALELAEIAFLVGFSEPGSLARKIYGADTINERHHVAAEGVL